MKEESGTIEEEVIVNQEKNKAAYMRVEGVVDHMIQLYEQAEKSIITGKNHQEVIQGLNQQLLTLRPLKTVREHFVHYYRKLSNLIRKLQNDSKKDNLNFSRYSKRKNSNANNSDHNSTLNSQRFILFFNQFINTNQEQQALQTLIVEHFLREGKVNCAKGWQEMAEQLDPNNLFSECFKIRDRMRNGEFQEAINWCQNEKLFQTRGHLLEYELVKAQILSLVAKGDPEMILKHFSTRFKKFYSFREQQIEKLMGYVLFKMKSFWGESIKEMSELYSYCQNRYSQFVFNEEICSKLGDEFMKQYLKQNNMSHFNVLKIVYDCSRKISDDYQRLMCLTWHGERKEKGLKFDMTLPFSIKLDKEYQYHSLFLCPVTKEVHSSGEPSILLSCGHMISQQAQERIVQQGRHRRRVKCPICQKDITTQESIQVEF